MKHQECLLLTKSLKGFFPPVLYSYSLVSTGEDGAPQFITRGDANNAEDRLAVTADHKFMVSPILGTSSGVPESFGTSGLPG